MRNVAKKIFGALPNENVADILVIWTVEIDVVVVGKRTEGLVDKSFQIVGCSRHVHGSVVVIFVNCFC